MLKYPPQKIASSYHTMLYSWKRYRRMSKNNKTWLRRVLAIMDQCTNNKTSIRLFCYNAYTRYNYKNRTCVYMALYTQGPIYTGTILRGQCPSTIDKTRCVPLAEVYSADCHHNSHFAFYVKYNELISIGTYTWPCTSQLHSDDVSRQIERYEVPYLFYWILCFLVLCIPRDTHKLWVFTTEKR